MSVFTQILGEQDHVAWWQECLRAGLIFAVGLGIVRLGGRRSFSKWSAIDTIVAITAGSNLSRAMTGTAPLIGSVAATLVLIALHNLLARAAVRSRFWSRILEGGPVRLGEDGAVDDAQLRRHVVSRSDLAEALRQSEIDDPAHARLIVLEPSGKISSLPRRD